jgi:DNA-binding Lrp family transcriptional regulator
MGDTVKKMKDLGNIEKISVVAGDYDIIARISVEDLEYLMVLTDKIQEISGIERTNTLVIVKEIAQ